MTNKEKQLLLTDLCGRLPYGVKICVGGYICTLLDINTEMGDKLNGETFHTVGFNKSNGGYDFCTISEIKPYLRTMSSMTKEEKKIMRSYGFELIPYDTGYTGFANIENCIDEVSFRFMEDFLNAHHFDYRDLIPMGLALEAPEDMYKAE